MALKKLNNLPQATSGVVILKFKIGAHLSGESVNETVSHFVICHHQHGPQINLSVELGDKLYVSGVKLGPRGPKVAPEDLKIGPRRILGISGASVDSTESKISPDSVSARIPS